MHFLLSGFPESPGALTRWAADFDESNYGPDPHDVYDLTWTELARRQGQTELARAALIRILDDTGPPDAALLASLSHQFAALGDLGQAIRARRLHVSLQDDSGERGTALTHLASLQRRAGDVDAAWQSLQRAVTALDCPPPSESTEQRALSCDRPRQPCPAISWRQLGQGTQIADQHFLIAQAAAPLGLHEVARAALHEGRALLDGCPHPSATLRAAARAAEAAHERVAPG